MSFSAEKTLRDIAVLLAGDGAGGESSAEHALTTIRTAIANAGGGAAKTLAALTDVVLISPQDGDDLTYDQATSKWVNAQPSGGGTILLFHHDGNAPDMAFGGAAGSSVTVDWGDGTTTVVPLVGVLPDPWANAVETVHTYTDGRGAHIIAVTPSNPATLDLMSCHLSSAQYAPPDLGVAFGALRELDWFSWAMRGPVPDLTGLLALETLDLTGNQLTEAPDLLGLPALKALSLTNNLISTPPNISAQAALQVLAMNSNALIAAPDLSGLTALLEIAIGDNQLSQAAVDQVLAQCVGIETATPTPRQLFLSAGSNAAPSGAGTTNKVTLEAAGWLVLVNS